MNAFQTKLFQRVCITRNQEKSEVQEGWTGTVMDYQAGDDHAQVEIDPRFAAQCFIGIRLIDLEPLSTELAS